MARDLTTSAHQMAMEEQQLRQQTRLADIADQQLITTHREYATACRRDDLEQLKLVSAKLEFELTKWRYNREVSLMSVCNRLGGPHSSDQLTGRIVCPTS